MTCINLYQIIDHILGIQSAANKNHISSKEMDLDIIVDRSNLITALLFLIKSNKRQKDPTIDRISHQD